MTTVIVIAAVAIFCAVSALILQRFGQRGRMHVPFWSATAVIGLLLGIVIGVEFANAFSRRPVDSRTPPPFDSRSVRVRHTLVPGDKIKLLESEGWLNGSPPEIASANEQLYVFDIWTDWCPVCADAAPGIVQSYQKFKDRGVQFVSLSVMPEDTVRSFVDKHRIAWPSGYGATVEAMLDYGAFDPNSSQASNPMISDLNDAFIVPTIYILRGDGTVVWTNENARYMHKPLDVIAGNLDAAIESALAELGETQLTTNSRPDVAARIRSLDPIQ